MYLTVSVCLYSGFCTHAGMGHSRLSDNRGFDTYPYYRLVKLRLCEINSLTECSCELLSISLSMFRTVIVKKYFGKTT